MKIAKSSSRSLLVKITLLVFFIIVSCFTPAIADREDSYKSIKLFTEILEELENNYVDNYDKVKWLLVHGLNNYSNVT